MTSIPVSNSYLQIDSLFESLRELAEASSLPLVPGMPDVSPKWVWTGVPGNEPEFIDIARQAGARLVYYEIERFDLDSIIRLQLYGTDFLTGEDEEDQLIVSAAKRALAQWSSRNAESSSFSFRFLVEGVAHDLHVSPEWFDRFVEDMGQHIEELEDQWEERQALNDDAMTTENRRQAEELARSDRYARAKNDSQ